MNTSTVGAKAARASALALGVAVLGGCIPSSAGDANSDTTEALSTENGLAMINGLSMVNGLAMVNGLSMVNGLAMVNGLSSTTGWMTTADGRSTVSYLVRCALAAGDTLVKQDQNGVSYTFNGAIGVAPQWKTGACDSTCQENISACLMAHVNTTGKHIALWLDGTSPAIGWGRNPSYPMQESAFFGNIFISPPQAYFCNGFDWDRGPAGGRIGANQKNSPYTNPFGTDELCQNHCSAAGYTGQEYGSCGGYNNVVTVYRDFDPTMNYNICSVTTGLCFEVSQKSLAAGAVIDQGPQSGYDNQKFLIERISADSNNGKYRVRAKMSGLYLDIAGAATSNGGGLIQSASSSAASQQWWLIQSIGSSYLFSNVNANLLLYGADTTAYDQIVLHGSTKSGNTQLWRVSIAQ
jgi:hypothetical protein